MSQPQPLLRRARIIAILAWALMIGSALCFLPDFNAPVDNYAPIEVVPAFAGRVWLGAALLLAGIAALGLALRVTPVMPAAVPLKPVVDRARPRLRPLLTGILLLAIVAEVSGGLLGLRMSSHLQFLLFALGIGLVVWGMGGGGALAARLYPLMGRRELWLATGVVFLAFFLRFWHLQDTMRVLVDELHFMSGILDFWKGDDVALLRSINNLSPFARLYPYWQTWTVELLGRNFMGFRAVSAVMGTLSVAALYALARTLFDRRTALLAALFLATFPPHIHFSRMGIIQIGDMLFGTLLLAFLGRALRTGRLRHWALAGAALGMTQYFYEGGRLLFPIITLLWLGWLWLDQRTRPALTRRRLLALFVTALIVAAPLYYTIEATRGPLTGRLQASGFNNDYWATFLLSTLEDGWLQAHLNHLAASFLVYVHMPERAVYYGGHHPFVLEVFVPLLLMGLGWVLWRGRALGGVVLLWVLFTSLGSGLLIQSAVASRFVVVFPALALLMAAGLRYGLPPLFSAKHQRLAARLMTALALIVAGGQAGYYFAVHLPTFDAQFREARIYHDVEDAMLRAARTLPAGTQVHVILRPEFNPNYNRDLLRFLADDLEVDTLMSEQVTEAYIAGLDTTQDHAFFIEPDDVPTMQKILTRFTVERPVFSPYSDVPQDEQLALYFAPGRPESAAQP